MYRALSAILRGNGNLMSQRSAITHRSNIQKQIFTSNTFKYTHSLLNTYINKISFSFSSDHHKTHQNPSHININSHKHKHGSDPIIEMRKQLEKFSQEVQQKHPGSPQQVIKQLYGRCQVYVGEGRKVQILMLFEIICEFIEAKNLIQTYSSFMVMSASNSFLMGKYQEVEFRCKLALPFEIKKHGQKHKNVGDIYNMLGISISKSGPGKGQEAINYLQKAFAIRKELFGQSVQAAQVLFNTGIVEQEVEKMLERAQENYLEAVQMLENCNIPTALLYIKAKMRLCEIQYKLHQSFSKYISDMLRIEQAVEKFKNEKKFQKHEQQNVDMFLSLLHKNLGRKFLETNQNAQAIKYFDQCLAYLRDNKMETQDRIEVLEGCAIAHANLQEFVKAASLLQQANKIVQNFPITEEYKFKLMKYLSQVYRKTGQLQKERSILQKMRSVLKNTKEEFSQPLDILETDICLIYCLGNLKIFDAVIEIGEESLALIDTYKSLSKDHYNDFKSNISAYVAFAYLSKDSTDMAIQYFVNSDKIFSQTEMNANRYDFQSNVLRKLASIYIQVRKQFESGFSYLGKYLQLILSNNFSLPQRKLNDLVILLIDYEVETGENNQAMVNKLIEAKYIENINAVIEQIVKLSGQISVSPQGKHILSSYYVLIDSIYQLYVSFSGIRIKSQKGQLQSVSHMRQLLIQLIGVYDRTFRDQIEQVKSQTFKGDEMLAQFIKKSLKVKEQLLK